MAHLDTRYQKARAVDRDCDDDDMTVEYDCNDASTTHGFLDSHLTSADQCNLERVGYTDCSLTPSPPPRPPQPVQLPSTRAAIKPKRARSDFGEGSNDDWSLADGRRRVRMESASGSPAPDTMRANAMSSAAATRNTESIITAAASAAVDTYDGDDESDQDGDWSLAGRSKLRRAPTPGPRRSVRIKTEPAATPALDDSAEDAATPHLPLPRVVRPLPRRAGTPAVPIARIPSPRVHRPVTPPCRRTWHDREPSLECVDSPETEARIERRMEAMRQRMAAEREEMYARWREERAERGLAPVTVPEPERLSEEAVTPPPPAHPVPSPPLRSPTPRWRPTVPAAPPVARPLSEEVGSPNRVYERPYDPYGGRYNGRYPRDPNHPMGRDYSLEAVTPASLSPTPPPPPPPVQIIRTVTHSFEMGGVKQEEEDIKLSFDNNEPRGGDQAASAEAPVAGPSRRKGAGNGRRGRGGKRGRGRRGGR